VKKKERKKNNKNKKKEKSERAGRCLEVRRCLGFKLRGKVR
jgi:hypothetical protein